MESILNRLSDLLVYDAASPMLFNSGLFLVLFLLFLLVYQAVQGHRKIKMLLVIAFSLYFYYKSSQWCVAILCGVCLSDYLLGLWLGQASAPWLRRGIVTLNVVLNVGMLVYFKYANLLLDAFTSIAGSTFDPLDVILPAGISFFTFRSISYMVDIYRGQLSPCRSLLDYTFYLTFFPPLLAGPVVRAKDMLPQVEANVKATPQMMSEGLFLIMTGLLKKVVIADYISGNFVDRIFDNPMLYSGFENLIGCIGFTIQLYCDFSGYSDMAIGLALLLGYRFKENFAAPFKSQSPTEFWRRWHISLTTWLRDYIYIPLGGSRCSRAKIARNTFVIFLVSGLWHGAEWTFIAWGGFHAALFLPMILTGRNRRHAADTVASGRRLPAFGESLMMGLTFLLVTVGWVIFRADNLTAALRYIGRMFSDFSYTPLPGAPMANLMLAAWVGVLLTVEWVYRDRPHQFAIAGHGLMRHRAVREAAYLALALACLMFCGQQGEFIYFQF